MSEMAARHADTGPTALALSGGERLLVWATRKYAFRCATACLVERAFREACGDRDGRAASTAFRQMLLLLARHGRRPLALGPPGWPGATPHEHRLLRLFSAAQARSGEQMQMHLAWLMPADAARQALPLVELIAAALRDHGCVLPLAVSPAPPAQGSGLADLNETR
ncbi:hypothetical protein [Rhodospirillaceae bacterium SYSU D60014]|uniref:hypothetical protein n=1 Tax=Virgifigura deserti TaxID=2268457 RepID=UPI0013C528ED